MELLKDRSGDVDGVSLPVTTTPTKWRNTQGHPETRFVLYHLLNLDGHGEIEHDLDSEPFIIGYLARIWLEKGLHC